MVIGDDSSSGAIKVFDQNLTLITSLQAHAHQINNIKQSPFNMSYVATGSSDFKVKLWMTTTSWTLLRMFTEHASSVYGLEFLSEDTIASGDFDGEIKIWSLSSALTKRTISTGLAVWSLQLLSNGLHLAAGQANGNVFVYNVNTGSLVVSLSGHTSDVNGFSLINANLLASVSSDDTCRVWDLQTNSTKFILKGHTGPVYGVRQVTRDILASCSKDNSIKLWNTTNGTLIRTLTAHTNALYWTVDVLDKTDSQTQILVSGSLDKTIKAWNVKTGVCLNTVNAGIPIRAMTVIKSSSKQLKEFCFPNHFFKNSKIKKGKSYQYQQFMGCYADESSIRDLNGLGAYNKQGGGSVESCIAYCLLNNFLYAGVQFG